MISCLLYRTGFILPKSGSGAAVNPRDAIEYGFDLCRRRTLMLTGVEDMSFLPIENDHDAVCAYFGRLFDNPAKLLHSAMNGMVSKLELAETLVPEKRKDFLDVCGGMEMKLTKACTDS